MPIITSANTNKNTRPAQKPTPSSFEHSFGPKQKSTWLWLLLFFINGFSIMLQAIKMLVWGLQLAIDIFRPRY